MASEKFKQYYFTDKYNKKDNVYFLQFKTYLPDTSLKVWNLLKTQGRSIQGNNILEDFTEPLPLSIPMIFFQWEKEYCVPLSQSDSHVFAVRLRSVCLLDLRMDPHSRPCTNERTAKKTRLLAQKIKVVHGIDGRFNWDIDRVILTAISDKVWSLHGVISREAKRT